MGPLSIGTQCRGRYAKYGNYLLSLAKISSAVLSVKCGQTDIRTNYN